MKKPILLITFLLLILSCSDDSLWDVNTEGSKLGEETGIMINLSPVIMPKSPIPDSLLYLKNFLIEDLSYLGEDIVFENQSFIIQSDMVISINSLRYHYDLKYGNKEFNNETAHWASSCGLYPPVNSNCIPRKGFPCDRSNEKYEIYVIIPSTVPASWQQATVNAIAAWNNLTNNRITFVRANPQWCDNQSYRGIRISLFYENNPQVIARAFLPDYSNPGHQVRINTNSNWYNSSNIAALTRAITHELGHTIGYWHTNETNGCFIAGTANVDNLSVMNSTLNSALAGFSNADIMAHNLLYPNTNSNAQIIQFKSNVSLCGPY